MKKLQKNSWDTDTNTDCFGNRLPSSVEHIWPKALGGSNEIINKMTLSLKSNNEIGSKTKGRVGSYRFSKVKAMTKDGTFYGILWIRHDSETDKKKWIRVVPINV